MGITLLSCKKLPFCKMAPKIKQTQVISLAYENPEAHCFFGSQGNSYASKVSELLLYPRRTPLHS